MCSHQQLEMPVVVVTWAHQQVTWRCKASNFLSRLKLRIHIRRRISSRTFLSRTQLSQEQQLLDNTQLDVATTTIVSQARKNSEKEPWRNSDWATLRFPRPTWKAMKLQSHAPPRRPASTSFRGDRDRDLSSRLMSPCRIARPSGRVGLVGPVGGVRQTRASRQQFSFADHLNRQRVTTSHVYSDHLTMAARRRRFAKALNPKLQRMKGYEIHSGHEIHARREIPIELWSFSAFYKESL